MTGSVISILLLILLLVREGTPLISGHLFCRLFIYIFVLKWIQTSSPFFVVFIYILLIHPRQWILYQQFFGEGPSPVNSLLHFYLHWYTNRSFSCKASILIFPVFRLCANTWPRCSILTRTCIPSHSFFIISSFPCLLLSEHLGPFLKLKIRLPQLFGSLQYRTSVTLFLLPPLVPLTL